MKILIADDNPDITDSFSVLLETLGFDVVTAYDGISAVETARAQHPDAALLDIRMPGLNGYEVAAALKELGCIKPGCLIGLTGEGGPNAHDRAREAGFDHFLLKPVSVHTVASLIQG